MFLCTVLQVVSGLVTAVGIYSMVAKERGGRGFMLVCHANIHLRQCSMTRQKHWCVCVSSRDGRPPLVRPRIAPDAAGLYDLHLDLLGLLRLAPQRSLSAEDGQSTVKADWTAVT